MKRLLLVVAIFAACIASASKADARHYYSGSYGGNYYRSPYSSYRIPYGYGYGGYINYGIPANSFASPAAFGFGPGAVFGF